MAACQWRPLVSVWGGWAFRTQDLSVRRKCRAAPPCPVFTAAALSLPCPPSFGAHRNEWTCSDAARGGHLGVLQWARKNGCPWNEWTCSNAAKGGHLEVLRWARQNGCPWNGWTYNEAFTCGHLAVREWAIAQHCPMPGWVA